MNDTAGRPSHAVSRHTPGQRSVPDGDGSDLDWLARLVAATPESDEPQAPPARESGDNPESVLPVWLRDAAPDDSLDDERVVAQPRAGTGTDVRAMRETAGSRVGAETEAVGAMLPHSRPDKTGVEGPAPDDLEGVRAIGEAGLEADDVSTISLLDAEPATSEQETIAEVRAVEAANADLAAVLDPAAIDVEAESAALSRGAEDAALALQAILAAEAVSADAIAFPDGSGSVGGHEGESLVGPQPAGSAMPRAAAWPPSLGEGGLPAGIPTAIADDVLARKSRRLEATLAAPDTGRYVPDRTIKVGRSEHVLRVLVPVVLVAVVVTIAALPPGVRALLPAVSLPAGYPIGPARMHDVLRMTTANDVVLVAFEYGPSQADELDLVAVPVIRQLVTQGASIRIVSTRADGLVAARAAVRAARPTAALSEPEVLTQGDVDEIIASGAFRPGDRLGVAHLLAGAGDLDAVVVFASSPSPLRWWVETVGAMPSAPPVVAGTSASIEGIAVAYLSSDPGLLAGAVSGVSGAAFYERISAGSSDGRAAQRLDALSAGNLAIILLVIIGAAVTGLPAPGVTRGGARR